MEKINYLDQYGRNNLTEKTLEYYLEAFEKTDPYKISRRLGIPYDPLRKEFTFYFLGQTYIARCSDFRINPVDSEDNLFGRNPKARILLLRYLLCSTVYFPDGEFKSYREFPSGELYYDVFRGRCIQRLLRIYSGRIPDFKEAAVKLGGILIPVEMPRLNWSCLTIFISAFFYGRETRNFLRPVRSCFPVISRRHFPPTI